MADGTRRAFSFNSGNAYVGRGYYKLNNTAAFSVFEKRLRSEYDEGYGNITQQQYDSFVVGETWWRDVYDLLGEPLTLERNDEYTSLAVTYMAWDGSVALLKFVSYEGTRNACQLVSKRIGLPTSYIEEHS